MNNYPFDYFMFAFMVCSFIGCGNKQNQAVQLANEQAKIKPILLKFEHGVSEACREFQETRTEIDIAVQLFHESIAKSNEILQSNAGDLRKEAYSSVWKAKANEVRMKVILRLLKDKKERDSSHASSYEEAQNAVEELRKQNEISDAAFSWGLLELENQDLIWHAEINKTILYKDDELFKN